MVLVLSMMLIRDLMAIYGLRHSLRSLFRVMTRSLFLASSTALMSTAVEFAMKAAHDRLATAVVGTAGEALVVARRMLALGAVAKAEIRPLPAPLPVAASTRFHWKLFHRQPHPEEPRAAARIHMRDRRLEGWATTSV